MVVARLLQRCVQGIVWLVLVVSITDVSAMVSDTTIVHLADLPQIEQVTSSNEVVATGAIRPSRVGWGSYETVAKDTTDSHRYSRVAWGSYETETTGLAHASSRIGWDRPQETRPRHADPLRTPVRIAWTEMDVETPYPEQLARIGWDVPRFSVFDERGLAGLPSESPVTSRLRMVSGLLTAGNAALYIYQRNAWWAAEHRTSFHFHHDGGYSVHLDKIGHLHATYLQAQLVARSLRWSGLSPEASALWGTVAAWTVQLNVEINDGFNALWGFDPLDVVGNTVGAAWFYARERIPELRAFVLKFNYWPSGHRVDQGEDFEGRLLSPVDDYMGHNYWMSVRVYDLLPESARRVWPEWLAVAAGVTAEQLYTEERHRAYFLALDLDLERIIPVRSWLAAVGLEALNFIKLPAPAIRLYPRFQPFLLYYGQYSPP